MSAPHPRRLTRTFWILWSGQTASLLGSALTSFALGVWIFRQTGSVVDFGLMVFLRSLPLLLVSPFAGVVIDRFDRRRVLLLADVGAAVAVALILVLHAGGRLEPWHIYLVVVAGAFFDTFQLNAYNAAVAQVVSPEARGRANGLVQLSHASATVLTPFAAGYLLETLGLRSIVLIDLTTFAAAFLTLLAIRLPAYDGEGEAGESLGRELAAGWRHLRSNEALFACLLLFVLANFSLGFLQVLFTPMVLTAYSAATLGGIVGVGGLGMLAGGLWVSFTGGPKRPARSIGLLLLLAGGAILMTGLLHSAAAWSATAFAYFFSITTIAAIARTIWQNHVPEKLHGKVFATSRMVGQSTVPVAFLFAPLLAEYVFEPAMLPGGALADLAGSLVGTGPGRGIALLFVLTGLGVAAMAVRSLGNRSFRSLDHDAPGESR